MKIIHFSPVGKIPTVVRDPGNWWSYCKGLNYNIESFSLNYEWWKLIFSSEFLFNLNDSLTSFKNLIKRFILKKESKTIDETLSDLSKQETYTNSLHYIETISRLVEYLDKINQIQDQLQVDILNGVEVKGLNYNSSEELYNYSLQNSILYNSILSIIQRSELMYSDIVLMSIKSKQELLSAMITSNIFKKINPEIYICLVDHGYENFSLHNHIEDLIETGAILKSFDSIISYKNDRDILVPLILQEIKKGNRPRGFLEKKHFNCEIEFQPNSYYAPNFEPGFLCEPILMTRLSEKRCYWSKCNFCTQNSKHLGNVAIPSVSEVNTALDRLEVYIKAGFKTFIFIDEALSPAFTKKFVEGIKDRKLQFKWAFRAKIECLHTKEFFNELKEVGCYEVLYGLESIVPRVQKMMGKYNKEVDSTMVSEIFNNARNAGVGLYINLIAGFPGEKLSELEETINFCVENMKGLVNSTFVLNKFTLFPDTPIFKEPEKFGICPKKPDGDIPSSYEFEYVPQLKDQMRQIDDKYLMMYNTLYEKLGWNKFGKSKGVEIAIFLYFVTGIGSVFKIQQHNPFINPLFSERR